MLVRIFSEPWNCISTDLSYKLIKVVYLRCFISKKGYYQIKRDIF